MLLNSLVKLARSGGGGGVLFLIFSCIIASAQFAWADPEKGQGYFCKDGKTLMASDLKTPEDARAFARCAKEYIQAHSSKSLDELRAEFNKPQWKSDSHYIWVDQNTDGKWYGGASQSQIYPPDASREGKDWVANIDALGNAYFKMVYNTVSRWVFEPAEGFVYYKWDNPSDRSKQLKISYVLKLDASDLEHGNPPSNVGIGWRGDDEAFQHPTDPDGHGFVVGAGVYPPALQADCDAPGLAAAPTPDKLQTFVRCAARQYKKLGEADTSAASIINSGFFKRDLRSGSIYSFVIGDDNMLDWSASEGPSNAQADSQVEWVNSGAGMGIPSTHNAIAVARSVGESFVYYRHTNPATGAVERKVTFLKLLSGAHGKALMGAGYYLPSQEAMLEPMMDCDAPRVRNVEAAAIETRDDLRAFVMKARCHITRVGITQARVDFKKGTRQRIRRTGTINDRCRGGLNGNSDCETYQAGETEWYSASNNMYIFVDDHKQLGTRSVLHIYPRDVDQEGTPYGDFADTHGNQFYPEVFRVQSLMDQGWAYYNFSKPGDGSADSDASDGPWKASYIMRFDHGGNKYRIGAGIYENDAPDACENITAEDLKESQDAARARLSYAPDLDGEDNRNRFVNGQLATDVELQSQALRDRATRQLQAFVRCAAREFEAQASFAKAQEVFVTGSNPAAPDDEEEARGVTGKWRTTTSYTDDDNEKVEVKIDGQYEKSPIYTFLYNADGELLWGRDSASLGIKHADDEQIKRNQERFNRAEMAYNICAGANNRNAHNCRRERNILRLAEGALGRAEKNQLNPIPKFEYGVAQPNARADTGSRVGPYQGMNALKVLNNFDEAFVYYKINDYHALGEVTRGQLSPVTTLVQHNVNKRSFMKKVRLDGKDYYIGAGLYE